jgi:hypothetical protein
MRAAPLIGWSIVLLSLLSVTAQVEAQSSVRIAHDDPFTGFKFPGTLGSFTFQSRQQYDHVDLGYGLNYVERSGASATIIVYDLNQRGFANGTIGTEVLGEFEKIDASIQAVAQQGGYREATRIEAPQLSKAWLQVSHELIRPDARKAYSHSFIRAQNGKFVKIRVTAPRADTYSRLPALLLDVSRALGMLSGTDRK